MLGNKAIEMIKERDLESYRLRQTCEFMESQTKQLIGTTSSIISEARARVQQDEMCMDLSGRQLVSLKTELAETIEINKQQQESIQNLRWIEDRVPDAQRRFAEMEQKVSYESNAYLDSVRSQVKLEEEKKQIVTDLREAVHETSVLRRKLDDAI